MGYCRAKWAKCIFVGIIILTSFLFGDEPLYNQSLLSDNGTMPYNTLAPINEKRCKECLYVMFSGEVELTGVVEYAYSTTKGFHTMYFYPDRNLLLPSLPSSYREEIDKSQLKQIDENNALNIMNMSEDVYGKLILAFQDKWIFGTAAMRVRVVLKGYKVGVKSPARFADFPNLEVLSPISITYYDMKELNSSEMQKWRAYPNTKDSYINLREEPKWNGKKLKAGKIIMQIQVKDLRGKTPKASIYTTLSSGGDWQRVFYFPPNATSAKDAIVGFIHKSQIKNEK